MNMNDKRIDITAICNSQGLSPHPDKEEPSDLNRKDARVARKSIPQRIVIPNIRFPRALRLWPAFASAHERRLRLRGNFPHFEKISLRNAQRAAQISLPHHDLFTLSRSKAFRWVASFFAASRGTVRSSPAATWSISFPSISVITPPASRRIIMPAA